MYLYELHCHTSEGSLCAHISGRDIARFYKEKGFDGICITDHFFNGNSPFSPLNMPNVSWEERVEGLFRGYEEAKSEGEKIGLKVFGAWEFSYGGTDFLIYCLDKKWLLNNPDCISWRPREFSLKAREAGAFVVQAHPYREAPFIEMIRLLPRDVDGVEVFNACASEFENMMAEHYAKSYNLKTVCGSDNHYGELGRLAAMEFTDEQKSLYELISNSLMGKGKMRIFKP